MSEPRQDLGDSRFASVVGTLVEIPERYWAKGTSGTAFDPAVLRAAAEAHCRHGFDHDMTVKAPVVLYLLDALLPCRGACEGVCDCELRDATEGEQ